MSLNTRQMGATLLADLKMKITARGINHSLLHCMDDSVPIPSTTQQRKGKHNWENTYIQQCLGYVHTRFSGPQLDNLNFNEVSVPPGCGPSAAPS